MLKKLSLLILPTLISWQLTAMENASAHLDFHAPTFTQNIQDMLKKSIEDEHPSMMEKVASNTFMGAAMPSILIHSLGALIAGKICGSHGWNIMPEMIGGSVAMAALFPIAFAATIPGAAMGSVYGLGAAIKSKVDEHTLNNQISLHLLQWVDVTKQVRLSIRKQIIDWQKQKNDQSIKHAVSAIMAEDMYRNYFDETGFTEEKLTKLLKDIDPTNDNWQNFFCEMSKRVKTPGLSDAQWAKLITQLSTYAVNHAGCPHLSKAEIEEYIYFATYFFIAMSKDNLTILQHYVGDITFDK